MRLHLLIPTAALTLTGALSLPDNSPDEPRQLEVARLRSHFDSVDAELRQAGPRHFTPPQQRARASLIGWLRDYRHAGRFPRNDRFPDRAMPFFRDSDGVLCAMAYLIDRSGRGDIVDRVASTRNNAFIAELADEPALIAWLDSVGISVAEAARIQPAYNGCCNVVEEEGVSTEYALGSAAVSGASLTTVVLNLIKPTSTSGWAGVIAGSLGLIAGAANLDRSGDTETLAIVNTTAGGAALVAGLYHLLNARSAPAAEPLPQSAGADARLALAPMVVPSAGGPRLGLALHRSF